MKPIKSTALLLLLAATSVSYAENITVYIGTSSKEIFSATLDSATGTLSSPVVAVEAPGSGFLAIHPSRKFLYATTEGKVGSFAIDSKTSTLTPLNTQPNLGDGPCHVSVDPQGRFAFVANYGSGSATSYKINADGSLGTPTGQIQHVGAGISRTRQTSPHAHSINTSLDGRFAYVADLGIDKIMIYNVDQVTGALSTNEPAFAKSAPGAGPRHFTFHVGGKFGYLLNELNGTITAFNHDAASGALTEFQTISTLPAGYQLANSCSEILCHPSGKFVYAANRGHNSIAAFSVNPDDGRLSFIERKPVPGEWPRNIGIDPTGNFLLIAATNSNNVPVLKIDTATGQLEDTKVSIAVPKPMCIRFIRELDESGFTTLFDGKTLDGWNGDADWFRVEEGAIIAGSKDKKIPNNQFLTSAKEYQNFELRYEAKLTGQGDNAGVQFWSQRIPNDHEMIGYQADIGAWSKGLIWGWLYDESRRRKMLGGIDSSLIKPIVRENDWNEFIVRAEGKHIRIWLNGLQTLDYIEPDADIPTKGYFGLQIHSGPPTECAYRNIRAKELQ
jgi:6-phosphogluconolactonase